MVFLFSLLLYYSFIMHFLRGGGQDGKPALHGNDGLDAIEDF